ncbi:MAG: ectoine/hydroxyectoine ABC transporter permease subunit EhuC [Nitrospinota bacterium]|nr:ectoine/hydroxyectoine ABC transporter permease subunit EhuC [Nitrospinota bacterium]
MSSTLSLLPPLLAGLAVTLKITAGAAIVALVLSFAAGLARLSPRMWISFSALVYIDIFRGTSALVQLFWAYFALPLFGVRLDAMTVGILVLGLNIGAYGAEVTRGAIQSIPKGQWEAATALNFTASQAMRRIIMPQALVAMLPPFGNLLIELLKSTALVSLITLSELTFQGQVLRSATMRSAEILALTLILYFITAQLLVLFVRIAERRLTHNLDQGGIQ